MNKEIYSMIHQSTLNKIIIDTIQLHHPKVGEHVSEEGVTLPLPVEVIANMRSVAESIAAAADELTNMFIEKNMTALSGEDYISFMCDLLSKYLLAQPTDMTRDEVEAAVILQLENTAIETMRNDITDRNYHAQLLDEGLSLEQIKAQIDLIDDGTIRDAYKTLLLNQINVQLQS